MRRPFSDTLGSVLRETARCHGDRTALVTTEARLTWAELDAEVDRAAAVLAGVGVGHGDVVAIILSKRAELVTAFLALARLGAVHLPVNANLRTAHIREQFATAGVTAVVTEARYDSVLDALGSTLPGQDRVFSVTPTSRRGWHDWHREGGPVTPLATVGPDDVCYINYTSGSSGRPKGVPTTHRNILANAAGTSEALGITHADVFMCMFAAFAHPHELFHRALWTGATFVLLDGLNPRAVIRTANRHRVTWIMAVPSLYELMYSGEEPLPGGEMPSVRAMEAGGAHITGDALARLQRRCGGRLIPVWGCTETTGVALVNGPGEPRAGMTGRAVPGYAFQIRGERGESLAPGTVGDLAIRGPAVGQTYLGGDPERAAAFEDGWYRTGDAFECDESGWFRFRGRHSDMLKVGGQRVYPLEIERAIARHPAVKSVAVVGATDRVRGEVPRAVVTVNEGHALAVQEIRTHCRAHLEGFKVPRTIEIWSELPRMPNGKLDKGAIRAAPAHGAEPNGGD